MRRVGKGALRAVPTTINGRYGSAWWARYALPTLHAKLPPMEWTDEGIVLGVRRHGESSAIAELLTRDHGRHLGLVRGGSGSRMRPWLQPGNGARGGGARRTSRPLCDRRHPVARSDRARVLARGLWRDPSGLAGAAVAGARSAPGYLRDARPHAR